MSVPSTPPSNQLPVHSVPPNQLVQSVLQNQLPVQSTPCPNQLSAQSTLPLNQLPLQSATSPNQLLSPTPPSRQSLTALQNDSETSSSSSYLQLQPSPSETRLTDTAETFCAALNVADDFLLDDYLHVTSSRHDTIHRDCGRSSWRCFPSNYSGIERREQQVVKRKRITAWKNGVHMSLSCLSSQKVIIVIYSCSVNSARHYGKNIWTTNV